MNELACRTCRKPLVYQEGCAICLPWKRHLVITGDRPEERVDLGDLTTETLMLAKTRLLQLRKWGPDDPRYSHKEAMDLIRTIAIMADSARKIRKEGAAAVNSMTFQEKAELFVAWWSELPPAHRTYVQDKLQGVPEDRPVMLLDEASGGSH